MKAQCVCCLESETEKSKGDLETILNKIIQARDNSILDLDGHSGDGEEWKDWRNICALESNWRLSSSGEGGVKEHS